MNRILYIDAHDSFAWNIIDMLKDTLKADVIRFPVDFPLPDDKEEFFNSFGAVVLGPGPGNPQNKVDVGLMNLVFEANSSMPVLGICLGFQLLCYKFGAKVEKLPEPRHGRVVKFAHCHKDIFTGVEKDIEVTLYHSLQVKIGHPVENSAERINTKLKAWRTGPSCTDLLPLAWYRDDATPTQANLMAVRHTSKPYFGLQFHPESCKSSDECRKILLNWWATATIYTKFNRKLLHTPPMHNGAFTHLENDCSVNFLLSSTEEPRYDFRKLGLFKLTTEKIYEIIDIPKSPRVVLELDDRYSILSVPSPGALTFEFSLLTRLLMISPLFSKAPFSKIVRNPIDVHKIMRTFLMKRRLQSTPNQKIPFWGGFLGFQSYEMGLSADMKASPTLFDRPSNDVSFLWVDRSIIIDRKAKEIYVQSTREDDALAGQWLDLISCRLKQFSHADSLDPIMLNLAVTSGNTIEDSMHALRLKVSDDELAMEMIKDAVIELPNKTEYKKKIAKCQELIREGESYELCLTDETKVSLPTCEEDPLGLLRGWLFYKKLRKYNPGRYSAFLSIDTAKVISSSPECFMKWDRDFCFEMMPMKGTVKKEPGVTLETAKTLLESPKEMGENLMIADLIRHDLNKLCGESSTKVRRLLDVEEHARVYQLVTHVEAKPKPSHEVFSKMKETKTPVSPHDFFPLLSTLPPGSMTGAPKIRSCKHLQTIEARPRGAYSGVMGFMDIGGGGCFSVLIRTSFSFHDPSMKAETYRIGAGGAITALSDPEAEWDEMIAKLSTVMGIFDPRGKYKDVVNDANSEDKPQKNIYIRKSVTGKMLETHRGRAPQAGMDEQTRQDNSTAISVPVASTFLKYSAEEPELD